MYLVIDSILFDNPYDILEQYTWINDFNPDIVTINHQRHVVIYLQDFDMLYDVLSYTDEEDISVQANSNWHKNFLTLIIYDN